ncbi:uncharacterized protein LAJ45_02200 [Morchella importuna]|uniref:uncharacterized protein n=1 Tax=Morchella importuna TaxID=1174673 RepID=UPI001E8DD20D|nr:uncharacterized protein LAJ45_02200 [Morchella importuna]KAH8153388.1 hypothetical protein LAJ45_02200 [Morchella importuna]
MNDANRAILIIILFLKFVFFAITFAMATPRDDSRCSLNQLPAVLCLVICGIVPAVFLIRKHSERRRICICLGILSVSIWYSAFIINALSWDKSGYVCISQVALNTCFSVSFLGKF